jgi:uncharacterized protein YqgQ
MLKKTLKSFFFLIILLLSKISHSSELTKYNIGKFIFNLNENYNLAIKQRTQAGGLVPNYYFDEFVFFKTNNNKLTHIVEIKIGGLVENWHLHYLSNGDSCKKENFHIELIKKKKGYFYNCVLLSLENYPNKRSIFTKNLQNEGTQWVSKTNSLLDKKIEYLGLETSEYLLTSHQYFSTTTFRRHVAMNFYIEKNLVTNKDNINNSFLEKKNFNYSSYNNKDLKSYNSLLQYINKHQILFENSLKIKPEQSLIVNKINKVKKDKKENLSNKPDNQNIVDLLKEINSMYKKGLLNEKEFNLAKKKLLNNR